MTESEFFVTTNDLFAKIETQLENADIDVDSSIEGGILELTFSDDSKIIINRHITNQEIWVASKVGGFHYQFRGGIWYNTRTNNPFFIELAGEISRQAHTEFSFIVEKQE